MTCLSYTDEMYEKIIYDAANAFLHCRMPGIGNARLTFNGFSKAYAMTGWRLGYVAGPKAVHDEIAKVQSHSVTHATSFAMAGACRALTGPHRNPSARWSRHGTGAERFSATV